MKLIFFGTPIASSRDSSHARVLNTLLEGVSEHGHHVVVVEPGDKGSEPDYCKLVRYTDWKAAMPAVEAECETASAIIVTSGFSEGMTALDWLLELPVP